MPKRKISSGAAPLQLNCSDGAKMLIEQMKVHPEEFRGYAGKFASMLDTARTATQGGVTAMSKRDVIAIMAAAEEHLYEVWLAEDVLTRVMTPKPEVEKAYIGGPLAGKSVLGQDIRIASNTITAQYDAAYQTELARYKMEIAKQRQEETEYAIRSTKPFRTYL